MTRIQLLLIFLLLPLSMRSQEDLKSFPEENHGTVAIPGMYDGIKQLFGK
ncbi:MAG: hypothetical protein J6K31_11870 [Parabacteroides sp.]|nr:hypothetical protein [Parabacteroides sp.]